MKTINYSGQFFLGEIEEVGFIAATKADAEHVEPHFCIYGETSKEAVDNAFAALKFYIEYKNEIAGINGGINVSEEKRLPFKSLEQFFVPKEVIFARAC